MKRLLTWCLILALALPAHADQLGSYGIDQTAVFTANTHTSAGVATDADSAPTYRVYEDETSTPILTGTMALLDSANTAGFYSEQLTLSAANGFEYGKSYTIYTTATVGGVTSTKSDRLQIGGQVKLANTTHGGATATLALESIVVDNSANSGTSAVQFIAAGGGHGLYSNGGETGIGILGLGGVAGMTLEASDAAGSGLVLDGGASGVDLLGDLPWTAAWDTEVQSEVNDALVALNLDHLLAVADSDNVVDNSVIAKMVSSAATADWSGFVNTTDSLQALRDRGDAAWITGVTLIELQTELDDSLSGYTVEEFAIEFGAVAMADIDDVEDSIGDYLSRIDAPVSTSNSPQLLVSTTIATLTSQKVFTLTAGSADNDAYNGCQVIVTDQSTSTQKSVGIVSDYVGSTKTLTLIDSPAFTIATGDTVDILANTVARISPTNVDSDDTWKFNGPGQTTSNDILNDNTGATTVLKAMDFTRPMPTLSAIESVVSVTIADVSGATEPTVTSSQVSADRKKVIINLNTTAATASTTYTFTFTILTSDSQTIVRRGYLRLQ